MSSIARFPSRSALALTLACAPAAVFPAAARAAGCSDGFAGGALDPAWSFVDADGAPGGSARLENGKLVLSGHGLDVFKDVNQFVAVRRADLAGDFDVAVKIESQSATHPWAQAGILAANDVADLAKGGYLVADVAAANGFHLFSDASGTRGTLDANASAGKTAYPAWIRLARTGKSFSAWYKTGTGAVWAPIAQGVIPQGTEGPSQIALFSVSHNDSLESRTEFSDFTCLGVTSTIWWAGKAEAYPAHPHPGFRALPEGQASLGFPIPAGGAVRADGRAEPAAPGLRP